MSDLHAICSTLGVKRLYASGSVVTEYFNSESDIDLLIAFMDKLSIEEYTNNYFALHNKLQELFKRNILLVRNASVWCFSGNMPSADDTGFQ